MFFNKEMPMKRTNLRPRFVVLTVAILFFTQNFLVKAEKSCIDQIKGAEWCVEGIKLKKYYFPERKFMIELLLHPYPIMLDGMSLFYASVNWWHIKVKIDKKLSQGEEVVTIAGYFPTPDYRWPDLAVIYVGDKKRKQEIENDVEKAKKEFTKNSFGLEQLGIKDPGPGPSKNKK